MAAGRSPGPSGRRRSRKRGPPPTTSPPPRAEELNPLPPGTEVEVRVDDEGFYGSWYEATVVGFDPASGRGRPAQYAFTYSHLVDVDGPDSFAPSHVRPRPPPCPAAAAGSSPPPRFRLHDFVEAFDCGGWWSGLVVAPEPADAGSPVTVAFPITREVLPFAPTLVRPRRDFVGGEWVPSRAVVVLQTKGGVRVYKAGEKVELLREREAYGLSWFPATVAKAVDRLSYIVEYLDDQVEDGKVEVYRHWGYIRPAQYHRPRESKVHFGPGVPVEVYCDGAWSQGVVRRVVREGVVRESCEYEVSVEGEEADQLLTKAGYQLRPLYMWNGRHWTIPSDKKQANLRQQSASRKRSSSPVDATSSDDEHSSNPEPSTTKKSRRELQQQELILDEGSEHVSASKNGLLCASAGHTAPQVESNHSPNLCPLPEKNGPLMLARKIVGICSMSKNELLCASSGNSAPPDGSVPNVIGETEFSQDALSEMVPSNVQLNTPVCGRNADEACDMLSIPEVRQQNIPSSLRNQQTQERPFSVKALGVKKGFSKNRRGKPHPKARQGENDASDHAQIQENRNSSVKEIICASSTSPECQKTSAWTGQVSGRTSSGSDTEGVNFKKLARKEGTLLDNELTATINRICQENGNADVCTDTTATQVTKSNPLIEVPILSPDLLVQQDGSKVDERSIRLPLQNAGSSEFTTDNILLRSCSFSGSFMPSHLASSQISGDQVSFVKSSPAWPLIDAMDVFKKSPQKPHFHPLRQFLPALREGMALGMMVTFANLVEDTSKSSIADSFESFKEKMAMLHHLEESGFNVQFLRCILIKLLQFKSDHISHLTKKDQLKAQLLEKTTSLPQIDERLDQKEQTIARLEEELGRARREAQEIAEEKEREEEEISRLKAADSSIEEACGVAELKFQSVLAKLRCKSLT